MAWVKSKFQGVRYREHPTRKHGFLPDRYYTIFYKLNGKMIQEALGWASESWEEEKNGEKKRANWTEKRAAAVLAELKKNQSLGSGPRTLKEKRALQTTEREAERIQGITISEFWEKDYQHTLKARIKPSSWKKEIIHYEKRIKQAIGNRALISVTLEDIEKIITQMRNEGLSPRTQEYALGTFFRLWKHAAKRKYVKIGDNPSAGIQIERVNNTRTRIVTPQEWSAILSYLSLSDPAAHDITLFCGLSGCRFSEAASLTWEFVDTSRNTVLFSETKNRDSREIFLSKDLANLLKKRGTGATGQYVFTKKDGSHFREPPSSFKTAIDKLGFNIARGPRDRLTMHSLRHTAATRVSHSKKVSVKDTQLIFGWKTPSMVFRYVKGDRESQKQAMSDLAISLSTDLKSV